VGKQDQGAYFNAERLRVFEMKKKVLRRNLLLDPLYERMNAGRYAILPA